MSAGSSHRSSSSAPSSWNVTRCQPSTTPSRSSTCTSWAATSSSPSWSIGLTVSRNAALYGQCALDRWASSRSAATSCGLARRMSELLDGFVAANALRERLEHAGLHGREVVHQLMELAMPDHHQPGGAYGPRRCGAWLAVDQRDLAEEVALPEGRDDAAVDVHLDGSIEDDEELLSGLALPGQHAAVDDVDFVREGSELLQILPAETGEERHPLELLELLVGGHCR